MMTSDETVSVAPKWFNGRHVHMVWVNNVIVGYVSVGNSHVFGSNVDHCWLNTHDAVTRMAAAVAANAADLRNNVFPRDTAERILPGTMIYIDTFSGLVPGRYMGHNGTHARIRVTATRGAYKRGEEVFMNPDYVILRAQHIGGRTRTPSIRNRALTFI